MNDKIILLIGIIIYLLSATRVFASTKKDMYIDEFKSEDVDVVDIDYEFINPDYRSNFYEPGYLYYEDYNSDRFAQKMLLAREEGLKIIDTGDVPLANNWEKLADELMYKIGYFPDILITQYLDNQPDEEAKVIKRLHEYCENATCALVFVGNRGGDV